MNDVKAWIGAFLFFSTLCLGKTFAAAPLVPEIYIYTYDSFISPEGLGPALFALFEKKTGCRVHAIPCGDGGQLLSRVELDAKRDKQKAHLVLGIDQFVWERIKPWTESWNGWLPQGYSHLPHNLQLEKGFLPYSYGVLSFISDGEELQKLRLNEPLSISDLLKPEWKRNFIVEDPRTSTPGLLFVLYLNSVFKSSVSEVWSLLRGQWLALTPGWGAAYQLFLKREAPLVWSYVSSQAYHEEHGDRKQDQRRYRALILKEGSPLQIEGAALLKRKSRVESEMKWEKKFLDFLLSSEIQKMIPQKNWMMPALPQNPLPQSFKNLPKTNAVITIRATSKEIENTLMQWGRSIGR